MSRKTSDEHDRLSIDKDGYRGGKSTDFNAPEPVFTLDYDSAAAKVDSLQRQGMKRYSTLMADGAKEARGTLRNKYGFTVGSDFGDYSAQTAGSPYAAILRPDALGLEIYTVNMVSADTFQTANRGGASGLTDDGPTGYLFYEDRRNPKYSIAMYEKTGLIPAEKVYEAEQAGLVQGDLAAPFRDKSAKYRAEQAKKTGEAAAAAARQQMEADKLARELAEERKRNDPRRAAADAKRAAAKADKERRAQERMDADNARPVVELTITPSGDAWVSDDADDSSGDDSPHPGDSGPVGDEWGLTFDTKSWRKLGLPGPLAAYRASGWKPAVTEWKQVQEGAAAGDDYALQVMQAVAEALGMSEEDSE